ncbi:hypothetical protein ACPOL_6759 (plasmid) [Acidisarcina polymorpha]|uniref:Uncharacterized protein n=1 Tax=Acidisarcina polymorpha TaxID=2211140 RepID=A0A2Z5GAC7_9BACT|nr:hypothetical protein ACPOL_6759 [Acidisarcina polymorpha]
MLQIDDLLKTPLKESFSGQSGEMLTRMSTTISLFGRVKCSLRGETKTEFGRIEKWRSGEMLTY